MTTTSMARWRIRQTHSYSLNADIADLTARVRSAAALPPRRTEIYAITYIYIAALIPPTMRIAKRICAIGLLAALGFAAASPGSDGSGFVGRGANAAALFVSNSRAVAGAFARISGQSAYLKTTEGRISCCGMCWTIGQGVTGASVLALSVPFVMVLIGIGSRLGLTYLLEGPFAEMFRAVRQQLVAVTGPGPIGRRFENQKS